MTKAARFRAGWSSFAEGSLAFPGSESAFYGRSSTALPTYLSGIGRWSRDETVNFPFHGFPFGAPAVSGVRLDDGAEALEFDERL